MSASVHLPTYEVFAIRYATRPGRRHEHFIGGDPHDAPMPMDYFFWVVRSGERVVVVDCGFNAEIAQQRKRTLLLDIEAGLATLGLAPGAIADLIVTHLHYDHIGNFDRLPNARFHIQDDELAYATGRHMRHRFMSHPFEVEDVVGIVRLNYAGRVTFHNGDAEIAPGLSVHLVSGHSAGLQVVRVHTERGWIVLASDAAHYYENLDSGRPFTTAVHIGKMLEAYDIVRNLADSRDHIIPGHDPLVMSLYPPASDDLAGTVAQLHRPPKARD